MAGMGNSVVSGAKTTVKSLMGRSAKKKGKNKVVPFPLGNSGKKK